MLVTLTAVLLPFALTLLAAPLSSGAEQPSPSVPQVGFLSFGSSSAPAVARSVEAFREGLREFGYIENETIKVELRHAEGRFERLADVVAALVDLKVNVIVTADDPATYAVKRATTTLPVVMATGGDPVGDGLIASFARPGGNVTGLTRLSPDLSAKRLELLQEILPKPARVAVLWNPANPVNALAWKEMQDAAPAPDLTLQSFEVRRPHDLDRTFTTLTAARPDGLVVLTDPIIAHYLRPLMDFATKVRMPVVSEARDYVDAGGLLAYNVSRYDLFRRSASYVAKILKGANPADLPVEHPTRFELVINMKTAKALGLTIPPSVLLRTDEVIE